MGDARGIDSQLDDIGSDLEGLKYLVEMTYERSFEDTHREGPFDKEEQAKIIAMFDAVKDRLARVTSDIAALTRQLLPPPPPPTRTLAHKIARRSRKAVRK